MISISIARCGVIDLDQAVSLRLLSGAIFKPPAIGKVVNIDHLCGYGCNPNCANVVSLIQINARPV
jgi:hypothetical protein